MYKLILKLFLFCSSIAVSMGIEIEVKFSQNLQAINLDPVKYTLSTYFINPEGNGEGLFDCPIYKREDKYYTEMGRTKGHIPMLFNKPLNPGFANDLRMICKASFEKEGNIVIPFLSLVEFDFTKQSDSHEYILRTGEGYFKSINSLWGGGTYKSYFASQSCRLSARRRNQRKEVKIGEVHIPKSNFVSVTCEGTVEMGKFDWTVKWSSKVEQ